MGQEILRENRSKRFAETRLCLLSSQEESRASRYAGLPIWEAVSIINVTVSCAHNELHEKTLTSKEPPCVCRAVLHIFTPSGLESCRFP